MEMDSSIYTVKGIAILDNDGNRIIAKYYDDTFGSVKEEKAFEKNLYNKTHKANSEIILLDGLICVYRSNVDLYFYVMGNVHENELMLVNALNCLYDSISIILRKQVEKKSLLDNMDSCLLAVDELCDQGIVMECDPNAVVSRSSFRGDDSLSSTFGDRSVGESAMKILEMGKEQLKWSLLK